MLKTVFGKAGHTYTKAINKNNTYLICPPSTQKGKVNIFILHQYLIPIKKREDWILPYDLFSLYCLSSPLIQLLNIEYVSENLGRKQEARSVGKDLEHKLL